MNDAVGTAVVDASYVDGMGVAGQPHPSRYLTSIANLPLIAHVVGELARGGIEKVLVVADRRLRGTLESVVRGGKPWDVSASFVETGPGRDPSELVPQIRALANDGPVLLHSGDCLFPGQLKPLRACYREDDFDLVVLVASDHGQQGAVARHLAVRRPSPPNCVRLPRNRPDGTAMILGPAVWPELEKCASQSFSVPKMVESLYSAGHRVGTCEVGDHWCFSSSTERLLVANRMLLDALPFESTPSGLSDDSDAQGRVVVSASAGVSRSTLRGPVLIGANAVVEDSFIGPYTAIGAGAKVVGAEIDYAMVLADAQVRYPGHRLEASVIGEQAVVSQSFSLPTGLHLRIGPGARVILG